MSWTELYEQKQHLEKDTQKECEKLLKNLKIEYQHLPKTINRHTKSNYFAGYPDFTLFFAGGKTVFVELKKEDGKLSTIQVEKQELLKYLGFDVYTCYSYDQFFEVIKKYL